MNLQEIGFSARQAALALANTSASLRNQALQAIARTLTSHLPEILEANARDLAAAENLPLPLQRRLAFTEEKLQELLRGLDTLIALPDPIGKLLRKTELDDRLILSQITCPIGVIGVIFEARPDALVQIAALCLKSGNAVLLKGGSEALHTNRILAKLLREASVRENGIPEGWLHLLEQREEVQEMLKQRDSIDLIIPRGSNAFVRYIMEHTEIPVMGHSEGLCHGYIDKEADLAMATALTVDAKTQGVSACNAIETLLIHQEIAPAFLPLAVAAFRAKKVRILGCPLCREILPDLEPASEEDWDREYLDYVISLKIVSNLEEAIHHINCHGSRHTEMIVTGNPQTAAAFQKQVDAADVFWNASTRFADGFRFGLGAEVGISTGKLHARGPVGLEGLCTYKWLLCGNGQCVAPYCSGTARFTHKPLPRE